MAYIPPHKRLSKDKDKPLPSPELPPHFRQNPRMKPSTSHSDARKNTKTIYAKQAISKWFAVGFHDDGDNDDDHELPSYVKLHPVSLEFVQRKSADKPLILLYNDTHFPQGTQARNPWEVIVDKAIQNLLSSFENVRSEMEAQYLLKLEQVKPTLVARFGKILFHGGPSVAQEANTKTLASETTLRQLSRTFYTSIPTSYMDKITKGDALEVGLDFTKEKDLYRVQLSDTNRPEATISCKCSIIKELNKLKLCKIELNPLRHMVTDISCLTKNLDLRLMLCSKRILTVLKDDEKEYIENLIDSAVLDPNVMGGLRWPLGKATSGDRFSVCGVWHTIIKVYTNPSIRLKARHVDRFDFRTSVGESASEVYLKLKGIVSLLQVQKVDIGLISKVLEDNLKLIWDHFLNCHNFLE